MDDLRGAINAWGAWLGASGASAETVRLRTRQIARFIEDVPAPWGVSAVELAGWLGGHAWAPETLRSYRSALVSFYRWARLAGLVERSPADDLPSVRVPAAAARPAPSAAVAAALGTPELRTRLMVHLAARQGLRRAEIARLNADDVRDDLVGASLMVHGKGGRVRVVPLHGDVAAMIRAQLDAAGGTWAFPGQVSGHLHPRRVGELVTAVLPAGWTTHTLRHYFATSTYRACGDLLATQRLLGHAKPETTQRYVEIGEDSLRGAIGWAA